MKYTEERPWGKFTILHETPKCKVKEIVVKPGERLSYQYHYHRAERWVIIQGEVTITIDDYDFNREAGEAIYIPKGAKHRIWNTGDEDCIFIEVQTGTYFGEDDIVRLEDNYGRV
jgi:mannose-6-phosphate isomerase